MGFLRHIPLVVCLALAACSPAPATSRAPKAAQAPREVCNVTLAGSNTIGERLAPDLVAAFLAYNGYPPAAPQRTGENEIRLVGAKGDRTCTVDIRSHGSSSAFKDLAAGKTLIGMASRPISDAEKQSLAAAGDFSAPEAEHVIALDGIAVIVNPKVKLNEISKADVKRIYLGQVKSWRSLGGGPADIVRYARTDESGTFQFFQDHVLEKDARWAAEAPSVKRFESSGDVVKSVAADAAGIGFVGVAYVSPEVKVLRISDGGPAFAPDVRSVRAETYPIARRLYLYTRPESYRANAFVRALVDYMKSPAAYPVVEQLKFISLRASDIAAAPEVVGGCAPSAPETAAYRMATKDSERLPAVIRFRATSTTLDALARDDVSRSIEPVRAALKAGRAVRLVGHSDGEGDAARNRRLAFERAAALRVEFEKLGALGLQVESAGEMCPVASNDSASGRQNNRRVEVWIERAG